MSKGAKLRKLKVFVTPIGFHDAYVAAPSRKAALAAWGSTHDLFARGAASEVTDPALMEEPLARPGEVVKRIRGTREEQIAAAGEGVSKAKPARTATRPSPPPRPRPPSRTEVEAAEAALAEAEEDARRAHETIARERAALDRREQALKRDTERLRQALEEAEADLADRQRRYERDLAGYEEGMKAE